MKKFLTFLCLVTFIVTISFGLFGCSSNNSKGIKEIKVSEVVRSVFYAPFYAAISEGYFEEEGLKIDLSTAQGADKVMQQLLSNNVDIGFSGAEQVLYIYNQQRDDFPIIFSRLTQKDGSFLLGRENEDFSFENLKGKTVIGGRPGGMPEMTFEYVLKNNNIIPFEDVDIITNLDFTATAAAFKSGTADYVNLFEPTASVLVSENSGIILKSLGEAAGNLPYTCFYATKSYTEKNSDVLKSFNRAIVKGQKFVEDNTEDTIAKSISSFFPGTDISLISSCIKNYKSIEAYSPTTDVSEEDYNRLTDIIESYDKNLLPEKPNFSDVINNSFK